MIKLDFSSCWKHVCLARVSVHEPEEKYKAQDVSPLVPHYCHIVNNCTDHKTSERTVLVHLS